MSGHAEFYGSTPEQHKGAFFLAQEILSLIVEDPEAGTLTIKAYLEDVALPALKEENNSEWLEAAKSEYHEAKRP